MIFWIASYPKSGNTWLRALLSSYYYSDDGIFKQNLLQEIGQFPEKKYFTSFNYNSKLITDTSKFWIDAQNEINKDKKIKFFKTHNILGAINGNNFTNKSNTIGALYIIRDPRNTLTSLQNHYELTQNEALEFMLNEKKFIHDFHKEDDFSDFQFISSWEKNYKSWIKQNIFPVKIIKYEDLSNNTFEIFKEIIQFIEKTLKTKNSINIEKLKNSIKTTSFQKMKILENENGFLEAVKSKKQNKKISFFYLGPKNNWKTIYNKKIQSKLFLTFKASLKELKYI